MKAKAFVAIVVLALCQLISDAILEDSIGGGNPCKGGWNVIVGCDGVSKAP